MVDVIFYGFFIAAALYLAGRMIYIVRLSRKDKKDD